MNLKDMIRLYLINECDVDNPTSIDVDNQILLGIEFYGCIEILEESMKTYHEVKE